jgi:hypothetical protein
MGLEWIPRDDELKDHGVGGEQYWGTHDNPPCTVYEKTPLHGPEGEVVDGLYTALITLNNPRQYNSYTTEMVKGVIAGFANASLDRSVVAVVFTGAGDRAFCTGGNTKEYAEYYARRPHEYGEYMDLFNAMVDAILNCKKPTICRVKLQEADHLQGQRDAGRGWPGDRHGLRHRGHLRPRGLWSVGAAARLGPGRRFDRLSAMVPVDGGRDVQLHLVRDVVSLQDEAQGPGHEGGPGASPG